MRSRGASIPSWPALIVGLAGAALVLLGDRGGDLLWAWRSLRFVSGPLRILLALAILALALPPVPAWIGRALRPLLRWPAWLLPLTGGVLFWVLRERTCRGDGLTKLALLGRHTVQNDPYVWKEPLGALAEYAAAGALRRLGASPDVAVALLSVLAGGVLLALETSQLWFGHVKNYSLVTAFCTLSVVLALGYLAGKRPLWLVGLTAGAAVSFHLQALLALPALPALLDRWRWHRQVGVLVATGLAAPLVTVAVILATGLRLPDLHQVWGGSNPVFWSPSQTLAPVRLLGALNNLWLGAPLLPLLLLAGGWAIALRMLRHDRSLRYLSVVAVTPDTPFCADPASDPTGCRRVSLTRFTMPENGDSRPVIFAPAPARVALPLAAPDERSFLWLSPALDPAAWGWGGDGVTFQVHVQAGGRDELLCRRHLAPDNPADREWGNVCLRLDPYRGQEVTPVLVTDPGPAGAVGADRAGWGRPWLMRGTPEVCDARP